MDRNLKYKLIDKAESLIKHIITSGVLIACVYIISDKISVIVHMVLYLIIVIVGLFVYILERNVSIGHKIAQMTNHSQRLEEKIDKNRSSSNLTAKGKTNPKDK
jgi:hypothetical protein